MGEYCTLPIADFRLTIYLKALAFLSIGNWQLAIDNVYI